MEVFNIERVMSMLTEVVVVPKMEEVLPRMMEEWEVPVPKRVAESEGPSA